METTLSNKGNRWIIKQFIKDKLVNYLVFLDEHIAKTEYKKLKND